ncbi:hypothetical protein ANCDUO_15421 [Ancylostoma duodenale]|uniref:ATP-dependent DNA helicase n=1 Tax=Ancylostoma duodenale TaxID=51022 RepID=A0A0C2G6A8_9BILA|nr:hypothetical protein ANCDUO_15421 [Ancylostoma duodenale]
MIHGPCGALNPNSPCMKDGKCSKKFPREFIQETQTGNDGYPLYRRRRPEEGGFATTARVRVNNEIIEVEVDNRWVVPYCPLLSKMFEAHINVEYCNSVKSIKYICKYVNKGSDMAVFRLENENAAFDEIIQYLMGRYISSNEAVWHILSFAIHECYPSVVHLSVHVENGQRVYFTADNAQQTAANPPNTTLTAFFLLCQQDPFARTLLYPEVPKYYTWNASRKMFCKRKQGVPVPGYDVRASDTLGRVYTVHPSNDECYYLRLLLHTVRGPTSFADLRTINGEVCETFREACQRLGLLENDQHWDTTLSEACETCFPSQLRSLFAIIITSSAPSNPQCLWDKYKESLSENILRQHRRINPHANFCNEIFNQALILIEDQCILINSKTLLELGLSAPSRTGNELVQSEVLRERNYNVEELENFVQIHKPLLVDDQRKAYDAILTLVGSENGGIFFLDAPGGTGKTFLINLLLAEVRREDGIALAIASSGIASTLLDGGRTAHSALKLPLDLAHSENPVCNIGKNSGKAQVLRMCKVIVWDECTMAHKRALEALDRTLQDIRGNNRLMGGAVVVLAGDFRQTLPVIPRSTTADELNACLKASYLWRHVQKLTLSTNMRVHLHGDVSAQSFAELLLQLGDGKFPVDANTGLISFPSNFCNLASSLEELVDKVFPNISDNFKNHQWLCDRAILAPMNDNVNHINIQIQNQLPGPATMYEPIDTVLDSEQAVFYPTEFLNSLEPPGMPPHKLVLKTGSPIMLLRYIDPPKLCNGTRLCVKNLLPNVIGATILTGKAKGEDVFIPRIPMIPTDMPFDFKRLQFPVRLAFAITINKVQGQSLRVAGINLETPCFSHGQLYVACSRVGTPKHLYIYAPDGKTKMLFTQMLCAEISVFTSVPICELTYISM